MSILTTKLHQNLTAYCDVQEKGGTLDCFYMSFGNQMYKKEFIEGCLKELDMMEIRVELGDRISNLEKLAYDLLKVGSLAEHNNI
jgi:hypothetical protein